MFSCLCLFAVTRVSCSCLLSLENSTMGTRVQISVLYLLCPTVLAENRCNSPSAGIYIGPCLQSSAEGPQHVDTCRPRTGFVNDEAGCCCSSWEQPELVEGRRRDWSLSHQALVQHWHRQWDKAGCTGILSLFQWQIHTQIILLILWWGCGSQAPTFTSCVFILRLPKYASRSFAIPL